MYVVDNQNESLTCLYKSVYLGLQHGVYMHLKRPLWFCLAHLSSFVIAFLFFLKRLGYQKPNHLKFKPDEIDIFVQGSQALIISPFTPKEKIVEGKGWI